MKIEIKKMHILYFFVPTLGIDIEYRYLFFAWLNLILFIGYGKK